MFTKIWHKVEDLLHSGQITDAEKRLGELIALGEWASYGIKDSSYFFTIGSALFVEYLCDGDEVYIGQPGASWGSCRKELNFYMVHCCELGRIAYLLKKVEEVPEIQGRILHDKAKDVFE